MNKLLKFLAFEYKNKYLTELRGKQKMLES